MIVIEWMKDVFGSIIDIVGLPIFICMILFLFFGLFASFLKVGS